MRERGVLESRRRRFTQQRGERTVIDRSARDLAAQILAEVATGELPAEDLESRWPTSADPALGCVLAYVACFRPPPGEPWCGARLPLAGQRLLARCRSFLSSDLPYEWPLPAAEGRRKSLIWLLGLVLVATAFAAFRADLLSAPLLVLSALSVPALFAVWRRYELRRFRRTGEFAVWPFVPRSAARAAGVAESDVAQ